MDDHTAPASAPDRPARVLVTKIGLDGHDRGSRLVARFLRDAGMEVIYTGPWQSIGAVCTAVSQEDVDVVGISSLAGDHLIVPKLMAALRDAGLGHVRVVVGGIIPEGEVDALLAAGVSGVAHPGATSAEIVELVAALAAEARAADPGPSGADPDPGPPGGTAQPRPPGGTADAGLSSAAGSSAGVPTGTAGIQAVRS